MMHAKVTLPLIYSKHICHNYTDLMFQLSRYIYYCQCSKCSKILLPHQRLWFRRLELIEVLNLSIEIVSPPPLNNCSSSACPSSDISCPLPSYTQTAVTQPIVATAATPHQAAPTVSTSNPRLYHRPATTGPTVLKPAETLCPIPCTVPSTLGCGEQLFSNMIVAGRVNVLAVTCNKRTRVIPIQIQTPEAEAGRGVDEGRTARYGARK